MDNVVKFFNGIFTVEFKWELIWLKNKITGVETTLRPEKFSNLLFQNFDGEQIKKLMHALYDGKKLLIDFDNDKVKLIERKDEPFIKSMSQYFSVKAVENWINNLDFDEQNLYKNGEDLND